MQVFLSVKSVTLDNVSAPKTKIFLWVPAAINPFANIKPLQNPAQADDISIAPACGIFKRVWTWLATLGTIWSGVVVATIIKSTSLKSLL